MASSYSSGTDYSEPKELTSTWIGSRLETKPKMDSQEILDECYGSNYYTYTEDFKYAEEYAQMVEKVNQYNGFYIGRYETTIDSDGNIGSEYNTPVLTGNTTLFTKDSTNYPYRWYGLYQAGNTTYDVDSPTETWHGDSNGHTGVVNSAQANPGETGDVALNIWDLEGNAHEWTQEANSTCFRVIRGGGCYDSGKASGRIGSEPQYGMINVSSRVALYIK